MTELQKLKMNDEYIAQNDIVKLYLQNKLTPEETVEFEEYFLDKPELLERLELDMVLVKTLPKGFKGSNTTASNLSSWLTPPYSNLTAIAASIALVAVLWFDSSKELNPNFSPNIVYLENYRSATNITTLSFNLNETFKVIAIDVPPNSGKEFNLKIVNENGQQILGQPLRTNENNEVTFLLNRNALEQIQYQISLSTNNNIFLDFPIKVILTDKEK